MDFLIGLFIVIVFISVLAGIADNGDSFTSELDPEYEDYLDNQVWRNSRH